jgi:hypothetical protein
MSTKISWHGTQEESFYLHKAVARNCACEYGKRGELVNSCQSHRMLYENQRALDGLLFMRRMAKRLRSEEFARDGTFAAKSNAGLW